jgi:hypothetical protein
MTVALVVLWSVIALIVTERVRAWANRPSPQVAWNRKAEETLEAQQFASWHSGLRESHLPLIKGERDPEYRAFMLDAEPAVWTDGAA